MAVCVLGLLYAAPNFLPAGWLQGMPEWAPGKRMNLGLDLQGGAHLLMKVDTEGYLQEILDSSYRTSLRTALKDAGTHGTVDVVGDTLVVQVRDPSKLDDVRSRIRRDNPDLSVEEIGDGKLRAQLSEQGMRDRLSALLQ
jgi:preprotein translocase subunit SecD